MEDQTESWGIFANIQGDPTFRNGAKIRLISSNGGGERWVFRGLNKPGRMIEKYASLRMLSNWRVAMIAPGDNDGIRFNSREDAEENYRRIFAQ